MAKHHHHHLCMPELPVKYVFGVVAVVSIISLAVTMKYKVASIVPTIQDSSFKFSFALRRQTTTSSWTAEDQMDNKSLRYKPSPYLPLNLSVTTMATKNVGTQDFEDWLPPNSETNQTCLETPNGSWIHIYQSAPWRAGVKDVGAPYLCVGTPGRLGNMMFTFASAVGIAALTKRTVVVLPTSPLLRHFRLQALVDCDGSRCSGERVVGVSEKKCCTFDPNMTSPRPKVRSLFIRKYMQSWRYFAQAEADVRRQMTAYGDTAARVSAVIARLRQELGGTVTLVGVHVRHGDIVRVARFREHGYRVPPVGYFLRAISFFAARHPRIAFLFSTDVKSYVQDTILPLCEQVQGGGPFFGRSGNASLKKATYVGVRCRQISTDDPVVDLLTLASCDHVIMSVGTFGWWAGWLAGGDVVYYNHPYRPKSTLWNSTKMEDFFPPGWIPMA